MFFGFFFFNSTRSLFSFTTTMRLHILLMAILSTSFYLLCLLAENLRKQLFAYVIVIAQLSLTIQLTVWSSNQVSNVRFLFHFTHVEIAYFIGAHFVPFGSFSALNLVRLHFFKDLQDLEHYWFKFCFVLNTVVYLSIFWINNKYISHYINRNDDLVGQNETIRIIIKEKESSSKYTQYFEVLSKQLLPVVIVFINPALTSLCKKLYFNTNPENSKDELKFILIISILANSSCVLGTILNVLLPNTQILLGSFLTLFRLGFLIFLAADSNFETGFLTSHYNWVISIVLFFIILGYNQASSFAIAAQRADDKNKNNTGYVMILSMMLGTVYGEIFRILVMRSEVAG